MLNKSEMPFDVAKAAKYLSQWQDLCANDGGKLWGTSLHTPFVIVDEKTRDVAANQDGFGNKFPNELAIGTTAIKHRGQFWAMAGWSHVAGYESDADRLQMFVHEAFHALQPSLFGGEIDDMGDNSHLNEVSARVLFLVEMNALLAAVGSDGDSKERLKAAHAALAARAQRRAEYGGMGEAIAELMEGTADYTQFMIAAPDAYLAHLEKQNALLPRKETLARSFGYTSGAMYCYALDAFGIDWKHGLSWDSDLGMVLSDAIGTATEPPCLDDYGYSHFLEEAKEQQADRDRRLQAIMDAFATRPLLRCSLESDRAGLNAFIQVAGLGEIRRGIVQYNGLFGEMIVNGGELEKALHGEGEYDFLEHKDGYCAVFADDICINGNVINGSYWKLTLHKGYAVVADGKDYVIVHHPA